MLEQQCFFLQHFISVRLKVLVCWCWRGCLGLVDLNHPRAQLRFSDPESAYWHPYDSNEGSVPAVSQVQILAQDPSDFHVVVTQVSCIQPDAPDLIGALHWYLRKRALGKMALPNRMICRFEFQSQERHHVFIRRCVTSPWILCYGSLCVCLTQGFILPWISASTKGSMAFRCTEKPCWLSHTIHSTSSRGMTQDPCTRSDTPYSAIT